MKTAKAKPKRTSKWVTFYWDMISGVQDFEMHDSKEAAARYFTNNRKNYFEINTPMKVKLPCSYGFPHRKFYAMSKRMFDKKFAVDPRGVK